MKVILILLFCFVAFTAHSQHGFSGRVLDSHTQQPIAYANVFFANTTIGTVTSETGVFTISDFPAGKYDLVVSFVGYQTFKQSLTFPGAVHNIDIRLSEGITTLKDIDIIADFKQKASDIHLFKKFFIGENRNSSDCDIKNIKELVAYQDTDENRFIAFARAPLEIDNQALGYKLVYTLETFEVNFNSRAQTYFGYPRFELLKPKKLAQQRRWEAERKRAYEGSFVQLVGLLRKGIVSGPFVLHELYKIPNRKRPPDNLLHERVQFWRNKYLSTRGSVYNDLVARDSMEYYVKLYNTPAELDSVGQRIIKPDQLLDATRDNIIYQGYLHVIYKGETEEPEYIKLNKRSHGKEQHSVILFKEPVAIYDNGYYEKISDVFFDGYMMWSDRISNLLPREYVPEK